MRIRLPNCVLQRAPKSDYKLKVVKLYPPPRRAVKGHLPQRLRVRVVAARLPAVMAFDP